MAHQCMFATTRFSIPYTYRCVQRTGYNVYTVKLWFFINLTETSKCTYYFKFQNLLVTNILYLCVPVMCVNILVFLDSIPSPYNHRHQTPPIYHHIAHTEQQLNDPPKCADIFPELYPKHEVLHHVNRLRLYRNNKIEKFRLIIKN